MLDEEKWHSIKVAIVVLICVSGLVTCHGFDRYQQIKSAEFNARQAEAQAISKQAALELQRLINSQNQKK